VLLQDELNHPSLFLLNRWLRPRITYPFVAIVHHLRCSERRPASQNSLYRVVERAYLRSVDGFVFNSETTRRTVLPLSRWERVASLIPGGEGGRPLSPWESRPGGEGGCPLSPWESRPGGEGGRPLSPWERAGVREIVAHPAADHVLVVEPVTRNPSVSLRLLFLGNLIPRKGLHTLLDALTHVRGDWRLTIVGNDEVDPVYTRRVRAFVETQHRASLHNRVSFLGRLDDAGVRAQLAQHDVLAVPSSYEGFGIVYLEALAHGLPVIAATAGAAGEIITHGREGFLVPPEDPTALAQVIQSLADDRDRLALMSAAAGARYAEWPTWESSMTRVREFLHELAARTRV
jgi:glycosyltransferase involved in cell wall biosynthesis